MSLLAAAFPWFTIMVLVLSIAAPFLTYRDRGRRSDVQHDLFVYPSAISPQR